MPTPCANCQVLKLPTRSPRLKGTKRAEGRWIGWLPTTTLSCMAAAFLVALALAVIVLVIFGVGERGTTIALRATARWSFLLFWFAYAGSAIAWLCIAGLARHGRELGLAYASAQLVHVGLILWIIHIAKGPVGAMVFFWVGIFCTYLLVLFSVPQLRDALEPRLWRIFRTIALEYIALAFAADFITLHADEFSKHPVSYLPFALMLVSGAGLRVVAFLDRKRHLSESDPSRVPGPPRISPFGRMSRENQLVVWPVLTFVSVIAALLVLDDALWGLFESALALYGPLVTRRVCFVQISGSRGQAHWRSIQLSKCLLTNHRTFSNRCSTSSRLRRRSKSFRSPAAQCRS